MLGRIPGTCNFIQVLSGEKLLVRTDIMYRVAGKKKVRLVCRLPQHLGGVNWSWQQRTVSLICMDFDGFFSKNLGYFCIHLRLSWRFENHDPRCVARTLEGSNTLKKIRKSILIHVLAVYIYIYLNTYADLTTSRNSWRKGSLSPPFFLSHQPFARYNNLKT